MTIFYPYPQHANMEVEEDVERVARWLGSIVPPSYLNAFYHKPSVSTTSRLIHEEFSPPAAWPRLRPCTHFHAGGKTRAPFGRPCVGIAADG